MIEKIKDAMIRFKMVYGYEYEKIDSIEPFRPIIERLNVEPRICFYPDGIKISFKKDEREITIDYNYDEPFDMFVATTKDGVLYIKDAKFENLEEKIKELV